MPSVFNALSALAWYALIVTKWYHATFIEPVVTWWLDNVLGGWEEAVKAFLGECFATTTRMLNGFSAWLVSLFFKQGYHEGLRSRNRRLTAWQHWWSHRAHSTFGAVLERDGLLARKSPSPVLNRLRRRSGSRAGPSQKPARDAAPPPRRWYQLWKLGRHGAESSGNGEGLAGAGSSGDLGSSEGGSSGRADMKRSGSELFERPSGYGISEAVKRRGLLEDTRLGLELAVTAVFEAMRTAIRAALFLPRQPAATQHEEGGLLRRQHGGCGPSVMVGSGGRPSSTSRWEDLHVWTASDVILQAGYPLEEHIVTTRDGYILHMQRIPRKGARDVAFFMHGILDTSLGWVANGVGSQAFAAWDAGHDVWLGNSRSNPPRAHVDPAMLGSRYWCYSLNELGMEDVAAQVEHIHMVKTGELQSAAVWRSAALEDSPSAATKAGLRRTASDSTLLVRRRLELAATRSREAGSQAQLPSGPPPGTCQKRATGSMDGGSRQQQQQGGLSIHLPASGIFHDAGDVEAVATARSTGDYGGRFRHFPFHPFRRRRKPSTGPPEVTQIPPDQQARTGQGSESGDRRPDQPAIHHQQQPTSAPSSPHHCVRQDEDGTGSCKVPNGAAASTDADMEELRGRQPSSFAGELPSDDGSREGLQWFDAWEGPSVASGSSSRSSSIGGRSRSDGGRASSGLGLTPCSSPRDCFVTASTPLGRCGSIPSHGLSARSVDGPVLCCNGGSKEDGPGSEPGAGAGGLSPTPSGGLSPSGGGGAREAQLLTPDRVAVQGVERSPGPTPASLFAEPLPAPNTYPRAQRAPSTGAKPTAASQRSPAPPSSEPYRLRAVGHSLGAGSLLIYAVTCRLLGRPHRLKRMVLLTPAGFHVKFPKVFLPFVYVVPLIVRLMHKIRPGMGSPAYLPSSLLRYITFKLTMDLDSIPGLNELTRAGISMAFGGDKSQWDRALQMPHYNTYSMPAISFHTGDHLMQLMKTGRFLLYDYGSPGANTARYGTPRPTNLASHYNLLADLPVDLVAGRRDGVIAAEDVMRHYESMRQAGVQVSYKEFEVGHLDVTFAVRDDIRHYVLSRLQLREWLGPV